MAAGVPPPPLNSPSGSYYWLEWYTNLTNFLNGTNIPWSNLNFTGSNIADILSRNHNSLQNVEGGTASGTATPTGHAYHAAASIYVTGAGAGTNLPSGWTVAYAGTACTVTHPLAKAGPNLRVLATSMSAAGTVTWVDVSLTTSFTVHVTANVDLSIEVSV